MQVFKRRPRVGDMVRVRSGNLGAGSLLDVEQIFRGKAGGYFAVAACGHVCYALNKLEVVRF